MSPPLKAPALGALGAFAVLSMFAHANSFFGWDLEASRAIQGLSLPGMWRLMRALSAIGDGWIPFALAPVAGVVIYLLGRRHEALGLLLSAGGGEISEQLAKLIVGRPRPSPDLISVFRALGSKSFPSGHATFFTAFFGFLGFLAFSLPGRISSARIAAAAACGLMIALVGVSRVYLGEHWPSDVLGGYLLGSAWLALSIEASQHWRRRERAG